MVREYDFYVTLNWRDLADIEGSFGYAERRL